MKKTTASSDCASFSQLLLSHHVRSLAHQFLENISAPGFPSWKLDINTKTNYITFDDKYFLLLFRNSAIFFALSWPLTPSTLGPGVISTPAQ
jgi:hypothetical protein